MRPTTCYAVLDEDEIALCDGRFPLFWRRSVAEDWNRVWLQGTGRVVQVTVSKRRQTKKAAKVAA